MASASLRVWISQFVVPRHGFLTSLARDGMWRLPRGVPTKPARNPTPTISTPDFPMAIRKHMWRLVDSGVSLTHAIRRFCVACRRSRASNPHFGVSCVTPTIRKHVRQRHSNTVSPRSVRRDSSIGSCRCRYNIEAQREKIGSLITTLPFQSTLCCALCG